MNRLSLLTLCAVVTTAALTHVAPAGAQQVAPQGRGVTPAPAPLVHWDATGGDPLSNAFFSPEVVMRYQQAIGLTAQQRTAIVAAISAAQPRFVEAQWQMEPEQTALAEMLNGARVDEAAVLQQIDRVLDIERQIKRIQIEMLVRIKNELTEEQQTQLQRLGFGVKGRGLFPPGSMDALNKAIYGDPFGMGWDGGLGLSDPWAGSVPLGLKPGGE